MPLTIGDYKVVLRVADNHGLEQDNTVQATVCDCSGADVKCQATRIAGIGLPYILGILGAILLLLCKFDIKQYIGTELNFKFYFPLTLFGKFLLCMQKTVDHI